jgi:hypothetical protein
MSRQPNVVQAGSGNGANILGGLLNNWQRKKNMDYRYSRENELLTRQHELGMERDTHKAMQSTIAAGTSAVINSHFDNILETNRSNNKITQIGESGNQDRETAKVVGSQDRRTFTHRGKQDRLTSAQKSAEALDLENTSSANKVTQTREAGSQDRRTITHQGKRDLKGMRDLSRDLYDNAGDNSVGVSPLVAGPGALQNIGPLLKDHPLLNGNGGQAAPMAPKTGSNTGGDDSGNATVTAPKVKKPRAPRVKKTGTYDDSYGGA